MFKFYSDISCTVKDWNVKRKIRKFTSIFENYDARKLKRN